ncbi:beta-1,3-galactosyltransferase 9-like [Watersipora subatra]|uniref:beta-1,3-galactosyltransferase 9-like n=1 Tax=Watersipora subatra TaxID=2589382 RepID=UPI00355AF82F
MPELLVWIYSSPSNTKRRSMVRETWANPKPYLPISTKVVFSLATAQNVNVQKAIDNEQLQYQDIIQDGSFIDNYKNLTYKARSMLRWTEEFCGQVKLLFKTDDDSLILPIRLAKWMSQSFQVGNAWPTNSILGEVWENPPVYRQGRYSVSIDELAEKTYAPKACAGSGYFITGDSLPLLVAAINEVDFLWLEDMYTTGRLAKHAGLQHIPINKHHIHVYGGNATLTELKKEDRSVFIVGQIPDSQLPKIWMELRNLK